MFAARDAGPGQIFLDITCVCVPTAKVATALTPWRAKPGVLLSEVDATALLSAWKSDGTISALVAPKILALDGQEASPFVGEEYRSHVDPAESAALAFALPEDDRKRRWTGVAFCVVPHIDSRTNSIDVTLSGRWREPLHPEAKDESAQGLQGTQVSSNFRFPLDGYALLVWDGTLQRGGTTYEVATLVHGRVLTEPAL